MTYDLDIIFVIKPVNYLVGVSKSVCCFVLTMSADEEEEDDCQRDCFAFVVMEGQTIKPFPRKQWIYKSFKDFCIYRIPRVRSRIR